MWAMDFKSFFFGMQPAARDDFAKKCETTVGHLQNVAYGFRNASPELAVLIERTSKKQVLRVDLFPDSFARIWPELAKPCKPKTATA